MKKLLSFALVCVCTLVCGFAQVKQTLLDSASLVEKPVFSSFEQGLKKSLRGTPTWLFVKTQTTVKEIYFKNLTALRLDVRQSQRII